MSLYSFSYTLNLDFETPANQHHFLLRCFPKDNFRQRIVFSRCHVHPEAAIAYSSDWAGNRILTGSIKEKHNFFSAHIEGQAETGRDIFEEYEDSTMTPVYSYPTPLSFPGDNLLAFHHSLGLSKLAEPYGKTLAIMGAVSATMTYESGVTEATTTAEKAFSGRVGVCQDYAHIMLALCRLEKLPARYVVGLIAGEGQSHAWVEVLCRGIWYGFDPTHNLLVTDGYLKISHGRDHDDCQINRGSFKGSFSHTQTVSASVKRVDIK